MADLLEFLWAVLNNWAGYSTGGIVVALVLLWQTLGSRPQPISRTGGITLAVLFLSMACYKAWREQRGERRRAEERLKALTVPDIQAEIVETNYAPVAGMAVPFVGSRPDDTVLTIIVKVRSLAAPSTVDQWSLSLRLADGSTVIAEPHVIGRLELAGADGKPQKVIHASDALYDKTMQAPLATGHVMYGALLFHVRRPIAECENPTTTMILGWIDATGKPSTAAQTRGSLVGTASTYPGMRY